MDYAQCKISPATNDINAVQILIMYIAVGLQCIFNNFITAFTGRQTTCTNLLRLGLISHLNYNF